MKLGLRIYINFAMVLIFSVAMGMVGQWGNDNSKDAALNVEKEFLPMLDVLTDLERGLRSAAYEVRGYINSGDEKFIDQAKEQLAQVHAQLKRSKELGQNAKNLGDFGSQIEKIETEVKNYDALVLETKEDIARSRSLMKNAAEDGAKISDAAVSLAAKAKNIKTDSTEVEEAKVQLIEDMTELTREISTIASQIWLAVFDNKPEALKELSSRGESKAGSVSSLGASLKNEEVNKQLQEMKRLLTAWGAVIKQLCEINVELKDTHSRRQLIADKIFSMISSASDSGMTEANEAVKGTVKVVQNSTLWLWGFMALSAATGIIIAWLLTRSITKPVGSAVEMAEAIRQGDFSGRLKLTRSDEIGVMGRELDSMADKLENVAKVAQRIAGGNLAVDVELASDKDSLGKALSTMTGSLNEIIGRINDASAQVAAGAGQVSDASQSLSQGATEQAASLEEISSSMTEIGSQTKANAENASQANKLAASARNAAQSGSSRMEEMMTAMSQIQSSSKEIVKIVKVIDDIAFQTNLLALNAAVEAARAGRHGKGFAVVAEEVRNLAARSAKAARETAEGIASSMDKVENGMKVATHTVEALKEIAEEVTKVNDLVGEIAAASNEQAQGISQISIGLSQVDSVTQQNTAHAEETASAAEELSSQSAELRQMLSRFTLRSQRQSEEMHTPVEQSDFELPQKTESWGKSSSSQPNPEDIIALDDHEFGRY